MKKHPVLVGLLQALGVAGYVALISAVLYGLESIDAAPPVYLSMVTILLLLVSSMAVTGALIFAYPAVLAMHKKVKIALQVLGSTLAGMVLFLIVFLFIILI